MKQYVSPELLWKEYILDTAMSTSSGTEYDDFDNPKDGNDFEW